MQSGLLKEIIEIYKKEITKNDFGEEKEEQVLRYTTRARLIHNNGNRIIENDDVFHSYNKSFQVRHYVPIYEYDVIKWNDKYYRVLDVEPNDALMNKQINTELIND